MLGQDEEVNIFNPEEKKLNLVVDFNTFDPNEILKKMKIDAQSRPISSVKRKAVKKKPQQKSFPTAKGLVGKKRY